MPRTEDKPEVAARVAWSGAGINLRTSAPTAPAYRMHAQRLAQEYAQYDAVARGTESIEKLIGTKAKAPAAAPAPPASAADAGAAHPA